MEPYPAIKKNEIMPSVATWTDLEIIIPSEASQREKDKYMIHFFILAAQYVKTQKEGSCS